MTLATDMIYKKFDEQLHVLTFSSLPTDLESGDIAFMSPQGVARQRFATGKWYQRAWNAIDSFVRRFLDR